MSRGISSAANTEATSTQCVACWCVELDFLGGFVRYNDTLQLIVLNGDNYLGIGSFGGLDVISEGVDLQARGVSLSLSGVDTSNVSIALTETYQGRDANLYIAFLDTDDYSSVLAQAGPFRYRMDTMSIEIEETATIRLTAESRMADWDRARGGRYTDEDQQAAYAGDLFFQFTTDIVEDELKWGSV